MKIIDLLNKIANGEELPKKFIYEDTLYYLENQKCYLREYDNDIFENQFIFEDLNKEIELIEEPQEHKIPEKLNDILRVNDLIPPVNENMYKIWEQTIKNQNKINEILDCLEELK